MELDDYQERTPQVVEMRDTWLRAFVGDDIPRRGDALGLRSKGGETAFAAVRSHLGGRIVEAMVLNPPEWLGEGTEVFATAEKAHIPGPERGSVDADQVSVSAGSADGSIALELSAPSFEKLSGSRPALETGFGPLDLLAPVAGGGINLVLDACAEPVAFDRLSAVCAHDLGADAIFWVPADEREVPDWATHVVSAGEGPQRLLVALRLVMSWAACLRDQADDVCVVAELPPLAAAGVTSDVDTALGLSIGEVIDQVGTHLMSTQTGQVTTLLRLPLHTSAEGIAEIIETMNLGDTDAQIYVTKEGRFEPYRSASGAELDAQARAAQSRALSVLSRAAGIRDKMAMLGEVGLDDGELKLLEEADAFEVSLVDRA